jgi:hypothetical protein
MNNKILNFIATIVFAFLFGLFLPWVSIMFASYASARLFPLEKWSTFLVPFSAIFLYWGIQAFVMSSRNDFILAGKISDLLQLGGSPDVLIFVTGVIGGLAAGIAAILGRETKVLLPSKS